MIKQILAAIRHTFGFKLIYDMKNRIAHDPEHINELCGVKLDKFHRFISFNEFRKLHAIGIADGCRWCMPGYNTITF